MIDEFMQQDTPMGVGRGILDEAAADVTYSTKPDVAPGAGAGMDFGTGS